MSWNPNFPRKRKRNRVSHGKPYRRRYFFIPVLCAILLIPAVRGAVMFVEWATRSDSVSHQPTMQVNLNLWNEIMFEMELQRIKIASLNGQVESLKAHAIQTKPVKSSEDFRYCTDCTSVGTLVFSSNVTMITPTAAGHGVYNNWRASSSPSPSR